MLFSFSFFSLVSLFVLNASNIYTVMGGQHRWAPAFLAARHHIYFFTYYCICLIWLIKLLLLVVEDRALSSAVQILILMIEY